MGEFIQIYGKACRFGMASWHPSDPNKKSNAELMLSELNDVLKAADKVHLDLIDFIDDLKKG